MITNTIGVLFLGQSFSLQTKYGQFTLDNIFSAREEASNSASNLFWRSSSTSVGSLSPSTYN